RNRSIIRCAPSSTKRRAISRPPWPTWTKSSKSIPIIRMHCSEKNFSKRNCTHHRHHRRRHPVPFLILTCVRQPPRLQHRLPSPKQGTALDCPDVGAAVIGGRSENPAAEDIGSYNAAPLRKNANLG